MNQDNFEMPLLSNTFKRTSESQAANYQKGSETQQGIGLRMIEMLNIKSGSIVLDLGCGTGYLTKVISEKVGAEGKVVAVDPDGERLKIARERNSASNIEYLQADDQTFPSGQYDLVFSNIVIHWISDKRALFERIYANLCPGGRFAFTTANGSMPIPKIGKKLFDSLVSPSFLKWMYEEKIIFWNTSEYETLAKNTGFTETNMVVLTDYFKWDNLDDYIDSMHGWFQGEFDPTLFDQDVLKELKREHGSGPFILSKPTSTIYLILTIPN